jgi:hypothetical protein
MLLAWVYLRDREQVEQAAELARTPLKLELLASMRRSDPESGPRPQFATCTDAETDTLNKLQSGALIALGLENGRGDAKEIPERYWATSKIHWDAGREPFAGAEDKFHRNSTKWYGLRFKRARILSLWPILGASKTGHGSASLEADQWQDEPTVLFLKLARNIGADSAHSRTIDDNLAQLLRDAVLGKFASGCLGWNTHENLRRLDPEEYPRHAVRPVTVGDKLVGYVPNEAPRWTPITPVEVVHCLAERGHLDALAALDLPEVNMLRRVAEAVLPPEGSSARLFIESLATTIDEARGFCRRHALPVPESLRNSPNLRSLSIATGAMSIAPSISHTGGPGRPTIMHLILQEFERRSGSGDVLPTLSEECEALRMWAAASHSDAPTPTVGTIKNRIRAAYRRWEGTRTK